MFKKQSLVLPTAEFK